MPFYQQYKATVADTLALFQFLEQALREYVAECYKLIAKCVPKLLSLRYSADDVKKDSLGTLVHKAKRFYRDGDDLLDRIEKVVADRNRCAHQSLLHFVEERRDPKFAAKQLAEISSLHAKVKSLLVEFLPRWQEVCDANKTA